MDGQDLCVKKVFMEINFFRCEFYVLVIYDVIKIFIILILFNLQIQSLVVLEIMVSKKVDINIVILQDFVQFCGIGVRKV